MSDQRLEIPGSAPKPKQGERWSAPLDPNQKVSATVLMRMPGSESGDDASALSEQLLSGTYHPASKEDAAAAIAASPADLDAVRSFLAQYGLTINEESAGTRRFSVVGTAQQMHQAFGVQLGWVEDSNGQRYVSYRGNLSVPQNIASTVTAVLGLDCRPIAHHA